VIELHVVLPILAVVVGIPGGVDAVLDPLLAKVLLVLVTVGHRPMGGHGTHGGQQGDGTEGQREERQIPRHFN